MKLSEEEKRKRIREQKCKLMRNKYLRIRSQFKQRMAEETKLRNKVNIYE